MPIDPAGGLPIVDQHKDLEQFYTATFCALLLEPPTRFVCQRAWRRDVDEGIDVDAELKTEGGASTTSATNLLLHFQLKVATPAPGGRYTTTLKPSTINYLSNTSTSSCVVGYIKAKKAFVASRIDEVLGDLDRAGTKWTKRKSVTVRLLHPVDVDWLRALANHIDDTHPAVHAIWRLQQPALSAAARRTATLQVIATKPIGNRFTPLFRRMHKRATSLLRRDDLTNAEREFRAIVREAEATPGVYERLWSTKNNLALVLDRRKKPDEALTLLHEVMDHPRANSDPAMNAAGIHFARGELDLVRSCLDVARRHGGAKTAAVLNIDGMLLQSEKKYVAALRTFVKARKLSPDRAEIWLNVGWTHHLLGDEAAALRELRAGVKRCRRSPFRWRLQCMIVEILTEISCKELGGEVIQKGGGYVEMSFCEGVSHPAIATRAAEAMAEAERARSMAPPDVQIELSYLLVCSLAGEYETGLRAAGNLLRRVRAGPTRRLALQSKAQLLIKSGRAAHALPVIEELTRLGAEDRYVMTLKAECLRVAGDIDGAFAAIGQLAGTPAADAQTLMNVVGLADSTKRVQRAIDILRRLPPTSGGIAEAWRAMAAVAGRHGTPSQELESMRAYVDLRPDDQRAKAGYASRLLAVASFKDADEVFTSIPMDALSCNERLSWGYVLGRLGKWDSMVRTLEQAVEVAPTPQERVRCATHLQSARHRLVAPLQTANGLILPGVDVVVP